MIFFVQKLSLSFFEASLPHRKKSAKLKRKKTLIEDSFLNPPPLKTIRKQAIFKVFVYFV